jgi:alkylhydroperoxidase/carboxymuconolactone decarboxylase family protein YurZ
MFEETQNAFIHLLTPEELRARGGGVKPPSAYDFGFATGMGRLLASHARIGRAMLGAFHEIMFAPGALSRAEREMLAAVASAAQDCEY